MSASDKSKKHSFDIVHPRRISIEKIQIYYTKMNTKIFFVLAILIFTTASFSSKAGGNDIQSSVGEVGSQSQYAIDTAISRNKTSMNGIASKVHNDEKIEEKTIATSKNTVSEEVASKKEKRQLLEHGSSNSEYPASKSKEILDTIFRQAQTSNGTDGLLRSSDEFNNGENGAPEVQTFVGKIRRRTAIIIVAFITCTLVIIAVITSGYQLVRQMRESSGITLVSHLEYGDGDPQFPCKRHSHSEER